MQHYHLPTRLLDWSESPLVALYFALEGTDESDDAVIWGILPTGLNQQQMGEAKICMPASKSLGRLAIEAFVRNTNDPDCRILSVVTEQSDPRHMVQQSAFTVHGAETPIEDLPGAISYLAKIRIPSARKAALRQVLSLLGVSRATLFPDLVNLAQEIAELEFNELT